MESLVITNQQPDSRRKDWYESRLEENKMHITCEYVFERYLQEKDIVYQNDGFIIDGDRFLSEAQINAMMEVINHKKHIDAKKEQKK